MSTETLKLTAYLGERDRAGRAFLADRLLGLFERRGVAMSVLLRGIEGFGAKHALHTHRLLTLSEDLPVVAIAIDERERIEVVAREAAAAMPKGLLTLERARLLTAADAAALDDGAPADEAKLTVWCGRREAAAGRPAHVAVIDVLHHHGVAGATALLGVDGTVGGERRRASFFGRNAEVPVVVVSVGAGAALAAAQPRIAALLDDPVMTLERVRVCRRDGVTLARPEPVPATDEAGLHRWQQLTVYTGEQARHDGRPVYVELVRRLRAAGAGGATVLRGIRGYHGDHAPHGERPFALRRRVPVVVIAVDGPDRIHRWLEVAAELTPEAGLVTIENVPALRAATAAGAHGGLRLAGLHVPGAPPPGILGGER